MKRLVLISTLLFLTNLQGTAQTNKTFFLGHSLINFNVPNIVDKLSTASSSTFSYDANIGNGATLQWHWTNPTTGQGSQWDLTLPNGGYENFILTEAVPLQNHLSFSDTYRYTDSFCGFANQYNPNIQYYMYETWHCTSSGNGSTSGSGGYPCDWDPQSTTPWRDRLDLDLSKWESIADSINLIHTNPMLIIPAGQAMGRLSDRIDNSTVPGLTSIFDLFTDDYHLDNRGNYFIACVVYSVIHGTSPVGLPNQVTNEFGNLYTVYPTSAQAAIMQEVAWEIVCEYPRDGVDCILATTALNITQPNINVYPVPAKEFLKIELATFIEEMAYTIYDGIGKLVQNGTLDSKSSMINVIDLPAGIYLMEIAGQTVKFMK